MKIREDLKDVKRVFCQQVNAFLEPELYPYSEFDKDCFSAMYAIMYDENMLDEKDLLFLDHIGIFGR